MYLQADQNFLDKELLRPGRFDRQIIINSPDQKGREEILKIHSKDKKIDENVDFKDIAEDTAGFTGAELANILNEAAIIATINKHESITRDDIEEAIKKVTVGLEKHSRVVSEKDKKLTAYHEAGHAVVSRYLETQNDIKEVSIIPRGVAGGYTMYKSNEDKYYISNREKAVCCDDMYYLCGCAAWHGYGACLSQGRGICRGSGKAMLYVCTDQRG